MSVYDQRRKLSFSVQEGPMGGTRVLPIPRSREREDAEKQQLMQQRVAVSNQEKQQSSADQLMEAINQSPEAQAKVNDAMQQVAELLRGAQEQGLDRSAVMEMLPQLMQGGM